MYEWRELTIRVVPGVGDGAGGWKRGGRGWWEYMNFGYGMAGWIGIEVISPVW